jgi:hypothetical protein
MRVDVSLVILGFSWAKRMNSQVLLTARDTLSLTIRLFLCEIVPLTATNFVSHRLRYPLRKPSR